MRDGTRLLILLFLAAFTLLSGCMAPSRKSSALEMQALRSRPQVPEGPPPEILTRGGSNRSPSGKEQTGLLAALTPNRFTQRVTRLTGGVKEEKAQRIFQEAEQLYNGAVAVRERQGPQSSEARQQFAAAAKKFQEAAKAWPNSTLEQDSLYWAGESWFFADHYTKANHSFEKLVAKYPDSMFMDRVNSRRFSLAQYWLDLHEADPENVFAVNVTDRRRPWRDTRGHALRVYDKIRIDDPTGKLADDATLAAANAQFVAGRWLAADDLYTDLRTAFPTSEHQFNAHYLGVQAKLNSYQGPEYTGDPLEEAEKLLVQLKRQFPRETQAHRESLARAWARLEYLQAQREWNRAEYYASRKEYRAAAMHYSQILSKYSETPFSDDAREQLAMLEDKPPTPPQRLGWLVDLFPDGDTDKPLMGTMRR